MCTQVVLRVEQPEVSSEQKPRLPTGKPTQPQELELFSTCALPRFSMNSMRCHAVAGQYEPFIYTSGRKSVIASRMAIQLTGVWSYAMPMANKPFLVVTILLVTAFAAAQSTTPNVRPRASDLGLKVGILPTGPLDAITDVAGVEVGQATIIRGDNIRTGVTAVLPHSGNLYREKVPGAIFVGNGFGKLAGSTQVDEMGDMETPILLTSTSSVPRAADALIAYMLA